MESNKITERMYLEEIYYKTSEMMGSTEVEKDQDYYRKVWEDVFCSLRNNTNPKYGGDPKWQGEERTHAEHYINFTRVLYETRK